MTSARRHSQPSAWQLAWRLLLREWRSGDLNLLASALILAVMTVAITAFVADRLQRGMTQQAAQLMGGDLVIQSPRPLPDHWLTLAHQQSLKAAPQLEFASMLASDTGFQLAAVKAISQGYPLKGELLLRTETQASPESSQGQIPHSGEVWVDLRLLTALGAALGDEVEIGQKLFRITALIQQEPDRSGGFMSFNPRAMINLADVPDTGVVQPGSRVTWRLMLAGALVDVERYKSAISPQLEPAHRLLDVREDQPSVGSALDRAQRYLQLTSIGAVILSGVAVALAAARFARRRLDTVAVLSGFGHSPQFLMAIYSRLLLSLGVITALIGAGLGFLLQTTAVSLFQDLLPVQLPAAGWQPWLLAMGTGQLLLLGFARAPLQTLQNVSPMRILRRDLDPASASSISTYGLALIALVALVYWYSGDWRLTLWLSLGLLLVITISASLTHWIVKGLHRLEPKLSVRPRLALRSLYSHRKTALPQVLAFALVLLVVALVSIVRNDLLDSWQQQLPSTAPNHFALNIQPHEQRAFEQALDQAEVQHSPLYPIVRARLTLINQQAALEQVPEQAREDNALQRELNLTWRSTLPDDNQVVAGQWWPEEYQAHPNNPAPLSIEAALAERLGLRLGDQLEFQLAGQKIEGVVHNLRTVNWDNFQPNFYVITPPGVLESLPQTLLASFYLAPEQQSLVPQLVQQFPAVSLLDIGQILQQVRQILQQVTMAIEVMLLFTLFCGLVLLLAAVKNSLDERLREGALYRTLGASGRMIRQIQGLEFVTLGLLSGTLAVVGSELTAYLLYRQLFDLDYSLSFTHWLILPLVGAVIITSAGLWGTRHVLNLPPLQVLRAR